MPFLELRRTRSGVVVVDALALISLSGATTVTSPTDARLFSIHFSPGALDSVIIGQKDLLIPSSLPAEKNIGAARLKLHLAPRIKTMIIARITFRARLG